MPIVMFYRGYRIYFWSDEGKPLEPVHVHISKIPHKDAPKFWVMSDRSVRYDGKSTNELTDIEIRRAEKYLSSYSDVIIEKWKDYFKENPHFIDSKESMINRLRGYIAKSEQLYSDRDVSKDDPTL